jgi:ubiquinone/menaquinone biosynthesis C-methylase UbiE/uncharacterized protein YbaR (Trm112 family)
MKKNLTDILACPVCLSPLHLEGCWEELVTEGRLLCGHCDRIYDIHAGLPLLLLKDSHWAENKTEAEGERELVDELPLCEHIKRNHYEAERSLRLLNQVRFRDSPLVLDIGGSSGLGAYLFKRYHARVVIVDIVPHLLMVGEANLSGMMDFDLALAGMEWLPFRSNTFDVVFCRQALHHSPNPPSVVRELFRVARIGGKVLMASEPCVTIWDILKKNWRGKKAAQPSSKTDEILDKLPDENFDHTWKEYEEWMEEVTDRFQIQPAGGATGLASTPNGLVFRPHVGAMSNIEKFVGAPLFGKRGFRGDINIIGTKMNEVHRNIHPVRVEPVRPDNLDMRQITEEEVIEYKRIFPMMFPFPI